MVVVGKYALWTVGIYLLYCAALFVLQRHMIFPRYMIDSPSGDAANTPGIEKIWLELDFGKVESWYVSPEKKQENDSSPVVMFAHGNGEIIDWWPEELRVFTRLGIGVYLVEYPGYGRSAGSPSEQSITRTFIRAYETIVARPDVDGSRIILFGRSLGGGAVCALAREKPSVALVLMSAFKSIRAFAPRYLAPGFLIRDPFDNLSVVSAYPGPVLLIHGRHDEVIPYSHGEALSRAGRQIRFLSYDCGHNDFPPGWFGFEDTVRRFLEEAGIIGKDPSNKL